MLRGPLDLSTLILIGLAALFAAIAYWKDPGLPWIGAKTGLSLLWFVVPRLIPALILAGMLQVLIPRETVPRYFGRQSVSPPSCRRAWRGSSPRAAPW